MCIYCGTNKYRKIYEQHNGPIPKDDQGRSYHIHHIDGNHDNNDPTNLKAVSVQEHYDIHYAQQDWLACWKLGQTLRLTGEEISRLASQGNLKRVAEGRHPFVGGDIPRKTQQERVAKGTHQWLGENNPSKIKSKNGTHPWLGGEAQRARQQQRAKDRDHIFYGGDFQRKVQLERVALGTHHFQSTEFQKQQAQKQLAAGTHPTQREHTCPHCGKVGKGPNMFVHHFNRCKFKD